MTTFRLVWLREILLLIKGMKWEMRWSGVI